jgi:hypothetical protein
VYDHNSYVRVKQEGDPTNATVEDLSSYTSVKVLGIVLAAVYFGWLLVHLVGTFRFDSIAVTS